MTPPKLPSFKRNEYVHKWLSSARPGSDLPRAKADERETLNQSQKRSRSHASPQGHRREYRHAEHEHRGQAATGIGAKQPSKKRRISTTSSEPAPNRVEPAVAVDHRQYLDRVAQDGAAVADRGTELNAHTKPLAGANAPKSPGKHDPSLKYARRPRHKTREDRYEYKGHEEVKKVQKISGYNKRSARRKSGAALIEEFQAPNVDSERLTLKQASGPGFLSKGKSSNPTTRRGIPDLIFSEMTFLNRERDLDDARFRGLAEQERPKKTAKGTAQDVSTYFAPPAQPGPDQKTGQRDLFMREPGSNGSGGLVSRLRLIGGQTLSEISRNRYDTSARSILQPRAATSAKTWHPDLHELQLQHFRNEERPLNTNTSADGATLYISCSPSIDYEHLRSQRDETSEVAMPLHNQRLVDARSQDSPQAAYTVHPRSSVSNVSRVKRHPAHVHRPPLNEAAPTAHARHRPAKVYYSLDDLKSMAKNLGNMRQDRCHDDVLPRLSRPCQRPEISHTMPAPLETHAAPGGLPCTDGVKMRSCPSIFADNAVVEQQSDGEYIVSRRDSVIQRAHYHESQRPSTRFAHGAETHRLLPAGPALWEQPSDVLLHPVPRYSEPRANAHEQSTFERPLDDHGAHHYDLMSGHSASSNRQHFHSPGYVPFAGEGGLDAFDADLLQSNHGPTLDFDPRYRGLESLLSPPTQRSRPPTRYDARELYNTEDRHHQEGPQAAATESISPPKVFEYEERLRPQLLRPSEEQPLEPEPFTGFLRPRVLY